MTNTISLIFNLRAGSKDVLLNWIKQKKLIQPIFITDDNSLLNDQKDFPCISIAELIPIMGKTEEAIYRFHYHYRRFFSKQFPIFSHQINLSADELHAYPFEITARCLAAFLSVKDQYQNVIFMFSQNDMALILQLTSLLVVLRKNKLAVQQHLVTVDEKKQCFRKVKGSFYGFYARKLLESFTNLTSSPLRIERKRERETNLLSRHLSRYPHLHREKRGVKKPLLFITTSAELHRRNFKAVYKTLSKEMNEDPIAIAITKKAEDLAKEDGIFLSPLISPKKLFCSFKFCIRALFLIIKCIFLKLVYVQRIKRLVRTVILRSEATKDLPITSRSFPHFLDNRLAENAPQDDSAILKSLFFQQLIILFTQQGLSARLLRSLIKTEQMERCFKEYRPTVVYKNVAASPFDHRLALIAKKYGVPVVTSIVASISNRYRNFGIFPCDFVTLLGENQKPVMYKRGYSDQQLICVGQPELDEAIANPSLINNLFTILITTGYVNLLEEKIWITALNQFAKESNFPLQILLKPHPSAQNFYSTLNHLHQIHILPIDADIYAYLITAQLVITDVSHAGKLAIYLGKPLMVINFSGQDFPFNNFAQEDVAWVATDETKMKQIIENIYSGKLQINQQSYADYIRRHLTHNDHQACKRITSFLLSFK